MLASERMKTALPGVVIKPLRRRAADRVRGFTLLELVIVLAIVALGAFVVLPNFSGMTARTFTAQVREANVLLNYARRTAVVTGQPATAAFLTDSGNDSSAREASEGLRRGIDEVWSGPGIEIAYRDSAGQQVNVESRTESRVENRVEIIFYPEGGSTGGELTLSQGGRSAVITIDPFSGKVRTEFAND